MNGLIDVSTGVSPDALASFVATPTRFGKADLAKERPLLDAWEDVVYEKQEVQQIVRNEKGFTLEPAARSVVGEISLKIFLNGVETASLLCLNQQHKELALGFLYGEGVIDTYEDVESITYNPAGMSVSLWLKEGISARRQTSLRSVTAGCGKCFTYINPLMRSQFKTIEDTVRIPLDEIVAQMHLFIECSDIYRSMGGVHSLLLKTRDEAFFSEDIGRHNCFDKVTGMLLRQGRLALAAEGVVYISGRVTSEIMTKAMRLGVPIVVSKSTPSVAAIKLAKDSNITLLGYVAESHGFVYNGAERLVASR